MAASRRPVLGSMAAKAPPFTQGLTQWDSRQARPLARPTGCEGTRACGGGETGALDRPSSSSSFAPCGAACELGVQPWG